MLSDFVDFFSEFDGDFPPADDRRWCWDL